jgi:hypothetical protein
MMTSPLQANEKLRLCDLALDACGKSHQAQKEVNAKLRESLENSTQRIAQLEANNKFFLNNKYLWFIVGVAAGGFLFSRIK